MKRHRAHPCHHDKPQDRPASCRSKTEGRRSPHLAAAAARGPESAAPQRLFSTLPQVMVAILAREMEYNKNNYRTKTRIVLAWDVVGCRGGTNAGGVFAAACDFGPPGCVREPSLGRVLKGGGNERRCRRKRGRVRRQDLPGARCRGRPAVPSGRGTDPTPDDGRHGRAAQKPVF